MTTANERRTVAPSTGTQAFTILEAGHAPLVAAAIHDGHEVRPEVARALALRPEERLREEDPFTAEWTGIAETRIVGLRSRFEVDLNRPREKAVYLGPGDAWGLQVWKAAPPRQMVESSLATYDAFYGAVGDLLRRMVLRFGRVVVYDLHSYNHRRGGLQAPPADPADDPELNLGTGSMDRDFWAPVVTGFMDSMRRFEFCGRRLDVRENVKFQGGHFSRWIHETFPGYVCVLAIEVKKFFMDEWTGRPDRTQLGAVRDALRSTVPGVLEELRRM